MDTEFVFEWIFDKRLNCRLLSRGGLKELLPQKMSSLPFDTRTTFKTNGGYAIHLNFADGTLGFHIRFQKQQGDDAKDIPFSLDVDTENKKITIRHRINGSWLNHLYPTTFPFAPGMNTITINAGDDKYEVFGNLEKITDYKFYEPIDNIAFLRIDGKKPSHDDPLIQLKSFSCTLY